MYVRLKLKPKQIKMVTPSDTQEVLQSIDFTKTPSDIVHEFCSQARQDSSNYLLYLLDAKKKSMYLVINPFIYP